MINDINLSSSLKHAIQIAQAIAKEYQNEKFSASHLLKAMLHREVGLSGFLESIGKDVHYLHDWAEARIETYPKTGRVPGEPVGDDRIANVIEEADNIRIKLGLMEINPICVLGAIARPNVGFTAEQLKSFPVLEKEILDLYIQDIAVENAILPHGNTAGDIKSKSDNALYKYCIDKTSIAKEGKLDPIIGRDKEVRMMVEILGRRSKPNVILVGEPGVGKTALVDGFAQNIINGNVPAFLQAALIFELDLGALVAGASYKGEVEDRLKNIIKEIKQFDKAILFIDEIHTLLDSKGPIGSSAANLLKPELARGEITIIGATTNDEYRQIIETDQAFNRRFEILKVEEPDINTSIKMVKMLLPIYEKHHNIKVAEDAVPECVRLAKRYIKDRRLPDAAIDLLDRTMAAIKMMEETSKKELDSFNAGFNQVLSEKESLEPGELQKELNWQYRLLKNMVSPVLFGQLEDDTEVEKIESSEILAEYISTTANNLLRLSDNKKDIVEKQDIASIISFKTGIPLGKVQSQEREKLLNMEDYLRKRVVGQDHALKSLSEAILESRSGLNKPGQPIGSFFLLGPTGTGKTELAKSIAEFLFNDEKALIRFDMSEFKEEHSAALLYGAPPGYVGYEEGGMLVNKIREQPYSVVLFDEIEKAHPSVFDIFLQILDEGHLHDRLGKEGDFSNAIILFTSNIGSEWVVDKFNKGEMPKSTDLMDIMGRHFRPEFLGRLTEIVPFAPITENNIVRILEIHLKNLYETLNKQGISLQISDEAKKSLALSGFTPKYGARPLTGVIRTKLRRPISKMIISGELSKGSNLELVSDGNENLEWKVSK